MVNWDGINGTFWIQADGRMQKKISEVVEMISKKPLPEWKKQLLLEVIVMDEEMEDVEVPFIVVNVDRK